MGNVAIPHAITVDDEIIQVFDPFVHTPSRGAAPGCRLSARLARDARGSNAASRRDHRGELTLAMLDSSSTARRVTIARRHT